jgi:hypothetical protein
MLDTMSLRSTQRPPRSCVPCSTRKVKCDKTEPCANCIRRREESLCVRETVLVRGEAKTSVLNPVDQCLLPWEKLTCSGCRWTDSRSPSTLDELRRQNERLKAELHALQTSRGRPSRGASSSTPSAVGPPRKRQRLENSDSIEDVLWDSIRSSTTGTVASTVEDWHQIHLPSRSISTHLVSYDKTWNSWVHYALEYPRFQHESDAFMDAMECGAPLDQCDPFWMAVYFSVLCVCPAFLFRAPQNNNYTLGSHAHDGR